MEKQKNFMIYGCNGYTGELISQGAVKRGLKPVLAGRNEVAVKALAEKYQLPYRIFGLESIDDVAENIQDLEVLCHCAGPFIYTSKVMAEACLRTQTHYTDITGEIAVFEELASLDDRARKANIMILPGTGFDVVPSDCLAAHLKEALPDAIQLSLVIMSSKGGLSRGTATTMIENLHLKGAIRSDGKIIQVPHAYDVRDFEILGKQRSGVTIPWGDVSTAYYSTGIPSILVYAISSPAAIKQLRRLNYINFLTKSKIFRSYLKKKVNKRPRGPAEDQQKQAKSYVWGEVKNKNEDIKIALVSLQGGYSFTAEASLIILEKILNGNWLSGFQTPSKAYGKELVLEISGTKIEDIQVYENV